MGYELRSIIDGSGKELHVYVGICIGYRSLNPSHKHEIMFVIHTLDMPVVKCDDKSNANIEPSKLFSQIEDFCKHVELDEEPLLPEELEQIKDGLKILFKAEILPEDMNQLINQSLEDNNGLKKFMQRQPD